MIGSNKLILNTATVVQALQEYLDKRAVKEGQVKVTGFGSVNNTTYEAYIQGGPAPENK